LTSRPVPVPDERSAGYWSAAAAGTLAIARCGQCRAYAHPPEIVCPHCRHTDPQFTFEPVSGCGTVRSWTTVNQSFVPGFDEDLPFVLVDVSLAEQDDLRLIGRLVDGPLAPLAVGAAVRVVFEDLGDGVAVPAFELARRS
jgi:uncharacterized OB-fold protein